MRELLRGLFAVGIVTAGVPAWCDTIGARREPTGMMDVGAGYALLSGGQSRWLDEYVRASMQVAAAGRLNAEVSHQSHFGDDGVFLGAGYTHVFDPSWYGALSMGASNGGIFLPRFRTDGSLSRKWLHRRSLVTTLGFGYYRSRDVYFDLSLLADVVYYFDAPWIAEAGLRLNDSNPGHVRSTRGFVALTQGYDKRHFVTLRYETGHEAYQVVAVNNVLSDFASSELSLIWRQWFTSTFGVNVRANRYENPSYVRWGVELGMFQAF